MKNRKTLFLLYGAAILNINYVFVYDVNINNLITQLFKIR